MPINCFRAAREDSDVLDPEPIARRASTMKSTTKMSTLKRTFTSSSTIASTSSTRTNSSIAALMPCPHLDDPKIDALMMPVPHNDRPSRCLRLSFPRIYSDLVTDMKDTKGCREWRSFAVFDDDDVDMKISAIEYANKRAAEHKKNMMTLGSF